MSRNSNAIAGALHKKQLWKKMKFKQDMTDETVQSWDGDEEDSLTVDSRVFQAREQLQQEWNYHWEFCGERQEQVSPQYQ